MHEHKERVSKHQFVVKHWLHYFIKPLQPCLGTRSVIVLACSMEAWGTTISLWNVLQKVSTPAAGSCSDEAQAGSSNTREGCVCSAGLCITVTMACHLHIKLQKMFIKAPPLFSGIERLNNNLMIIRKNYVVTTSIHCNVYRCHISLYANIFFLFFSLMFYVPKLMHNSRSLCITKKNFFAWIVVIVLSHVHSLVCMLCVKLSLVCPER